jgi:hypothetical protein
LLLNLTFSEVNILYIPDGELPKKKKIVQKVITVEGKFQKVPRHSKKNEIFTETDDEDIQDVDEEVQEADEDGQEADEDVQDADEDAGSSGSDFHPSANSGAESGDALDYTSINGKTTD